MAFALAAIGVVVPGAAGASAATCRTTQPPNAGTHANVLLGVTAVSSRNAWAIGFYDGVAFRARSLIEHWNGHAWKLEASPNPQGSDDSVLYGVAATSSTNIWAVGDSYTINDITYRNLIEHWNGRTWKVQPSPNLPGSQLFGVAATSPTNVWAVGRDRTGALIEHWNGRTWKVQPSPNLAGSDLLGVTAISPTNAWAAGSDDHDTLVEHWNGRTWKVQASPNPQFVQSQYLELSGMAATSSTNAWAVGYAYSSFMFPSPLSDQRHTLIEHWNGKAWTVQAGPDLGAGQLASQLLGVAATRSTNVWAVGSNGDSSLIEHWNGKAWNVQPSPNPAGTRSTTCPPGLRATPWRWVPTAPTRPTPGLSPRDAAEQQASCGPTLSPDAFSLLEKTRASAHLS